MTLSIGMAQSGAIYRDWQIRKDNRNRLSVGSFKEIELEAVPLSRGEISLSAALKVEIGADVPMDKVESFLKENVELPKIPGYGAFGNPVIEPVVHPVNMQGGTSISDYLGKGSSQNYRVTYSSFPSEKSESAQGVLEVPLTNDDISSVAFVSGFNSRAATDVRCEIVFSGGSTVDCKDAPHPRLRSNFVSPGDLRFKVGGDLPILRSSLKETPLAVRFRYRWVDSPDIG